MKLLRIVSKISWFQEGSLIYGQIMNILSISKKCSEMIRNGNVAT